MKRNLMPMSTGENHFMPYGNERIEIIDFWVSRQRSNS